MDPQSETAPYPVVEHQEYLLRTPPGGRGFPRPPNSATHIVDQIERGGARIEETLSRLNCRYQTLFFLAAWATILASLIGMGVSIAHLEISTLFNCIFLLAFGVVMMLLDFPGNPRWAGAQRRGVRKYARFLTRLTGKSLWFLYLGCMVIVCLWPRRPAITSGFLLFLALALSLSINFVGAVGLFIALRKSLRLERLRKAINLSYQGSWNDVYRKYAVNDPSHGMQYEEFNRMASDYTQGKLLFDLSDLQIIFNALDDHQKSAINESEFGVWAAGGYETELTDHDASRLAMTFL